MVEHSAILRPRRTEPRGVDALGSTPLPRLSKGGRCRSVHGSAVAVGLLAIREREHRPGSRALHAQLPPADPHRTASPDRCVLDGMSLVGAIELRDQAVRLLCGDERLTDCAIATLKASPAANCRSTGLDVIANHCSAVLESRLARPSRAPPTTGRSNSRQDVAASCAISCVTSSPIRPRQRSSGHSPRNAEPMCIAESTAPNCRSNTRPGGSDDPTPLC